MITQPVVDGLCAELSLGWTGRDFDALSQELAPYLVAMEAHFKSGEAVASHIANAASLCAPITEITDPYQLYDTAEGTVSRESFEVKEYPAYWITTHVSTVPVVLLLLKRPPEPLEALTDLCLRCSAATGKRVGDTRYLQWNQPGFSWKLHTDDEYEGVSSRVHVPLVTTPQNLFAWADTLDAPRREWRLTTHLERGKAYHARTDVPHTAINEHPTDGRVHLILDVAS